MRMQNTTLACPETKDETHLLPLPLFVTIAEFDPADQTPLLVCRLVSFTASPAVAALPLESFRV